MESVTLILRLALVVVFLTAGVAKLFDLEKSRATVEAFGMPRRLSRIGGTALPFAELLTAAALLPQQSARGGAVAAALMLLAFMGGITYALSQGLRPDCNCFGQVSSAEIGVTTLVRNGVLLAAAAVAVWKGPGSSLSSWTSSQTAADLVAAVAVLAAALLAITAFNYRQRAATAPLPGTAGAPEAGLPVGSPAPDFSLRALSGATVNVQSLVASRLPSVLVFASQTCGPCMMLMPEIARWTAALNERLNLVVVESGVRNVEGLRTQLASAGEVNALFEPDHDAAERYLVRGTPTAVAIDSSGRIAAPPALGAAAVEALVRSTLHTAAAPLTSAPASQLVATGS